MMHYDLAYQNKPSIRDNCYSEDKVFFGLVETCFEGKDYIEYFTELREYMSMIENYLNEWFRIDINKIHWDL